MELEDVLKILESGSSKEKIAALELQKDAGDARVVRGIIARLDDGDIRVRGEAFSSLVSSKGKISHHLIQGLDSASKNVRGHVALVLANRGESGAVPSIAKLATDGHPMVRACALGALGYLGARGVGDIIRRCATDPDMEVRKSAIKAAIGTCEPLPDNIIREILQQKDPETETLLAQVGRNA